MRRNLLTGPASLALLRGLTTPAQAVAETTVDKTVLLKLETVTTRPSPQSPSVADLRFAGLEKGSLIRLQKGQTLVLKVENGLLEPTSLQWHGLRGLGALDDPGTKALRDIRPGETRTVRVLPRDSGTAWFHSVPSSANETARGARGVLIVEELDRPVVDQDLLAVLADQMLSADEHLRFGSTAPAAVKTVLFTVNGDPCPAVLSGRPRSRVRLRLVNASMQRVMLIACEGARPMILAIDGQPSDLFEPIHGSMPMGPGARFDIALDLPATVGASVRFNLKATERLAGALEPERSLLTITTEGIPLEPRSPIVALAMNPALPRQIRLEAAKRADLVFDGKAGSQDAVASGWSVNGMPSATAASRPVLSVRQGDAITFGLLNKSSATVPLRFQGQVMRLLHAKDDGWEPYWRDSVLLPPNSRNHVAFVADIPGRWPIESGFDDLTLAGLRCWFEVKPR